MRANARRYMMSLLAVLVLGVGSGVLGAAASPDCKARLAERPLPGGLRFSEIRDVAEELVKRYPPETHHLVVLGRSLFPVVDYLGLARPGYASLVPLSYNTKDLPLSWFERLRGLTGAIPQGPYTDEIRQLAPKGYRRDDALVEVRVPGMRERCFDFLDRFFPGDMALAGRAVVLVDYSSGHSLMSFLVDVVRYRDARRPGVRVRGTISVQKTSSDVYWPITFAGMRKHVWPTRVSDDGYSGAEFDHQQLGLGRFLPFLPPAAVEAPFLATALDRQTHKVYAPYDTFTLWDAQAGELPKPRPEKHGAFLDELTRAFQTK